MIRRIYRSAMSRAKALAIKTCIAGRIDMRHVFMLTSSPRSGSTLLGQVLEAIPNSTVLFEPCFTEKVPEAKAANFPRRPYVAPEDAWPVGKAFLDRVFEGRVINPWTSKEMAFPAACRAQNLIVKFVRANRLLPWICRTYEMPPPLYLIRHPCAVVASQLICGWTMGERPEVPQFLDRYPVFRDALMKTQSDEEYLAALWALDQLPPLLEPAPRPWTVLTYEELVLRPRETLTKVFRRWDVEVDMDDALSRLGKPSSVVSMTGMSGIGGWKKQLSEKQITQILATVHAFGLRFYSRADEPDYAEFYSEGLPGYLHCIGIDAPAPTSATEESRPCSSLAAGSLS